MSYEFVTNVGLVVSAIRIVENDARLLAHEVESAGPMYTKNHDFTRRIDFLLGKLEDARRLANP